jgi:hypothetical protein
VRSYLSSLIVGVILLCCASQARAGFLLSNTGSGTSRDDFTGQVGAYFQVVNAVNVTELGFYDAPNVGGGSVGDGLKVAHTITLYVQNPAAQNIDGFATFTAVPGATVTIPKTTLNDGTTLDSSGFRYEALPASVALIAGDKYVLLATTGNGDGDKFLDFNGTPSYDSNFTMLGRTYTTYTSGAPNEGANGSNSTAQFSAGVGPYVGPNLEYGSSSSQSTATPEPATMTSLGVGLFCLGCYRRRQRRLLAAG